MLCLPGPNTTPSSIGRMNKTKQRKMGKEGSYLDRRCLCWIWKPKRKLENSMKQREGTKIPASTWTGGDFVEYENPKWNWKTASRANKNRLGKRLESSTWLNPEHTIVSIFSTMHNQVKLHFLPVGKKFPSRISREQDLITKPTASTMYIWKRHNNRNNYHCWMGWWCDEEIPT